jgi:hypothetical protein
MMSKLLCGLAVSLICGAAFAQENYTVEGVAKVRDNEVARFYPDSVRQSGGETMFDIVVRYAVPEDVPPGGAASRKISYRAHCDSKELTISLIALRNVKGQMMKMITVPPGAEEYFKPAAGSREADWLYRACG